MPRSYIPGDRNRFVPHLGVVQALNRSIEGIHIDM